MKKPIKIIIHIILVLLITGLGFWAYGALKAKKTDIKRKRHHVPAPIVRVERVVAGSQAVVIEAEGTVKASREIRLAPRVGGRVVSISPALVDGGAFKKGETLLTIDPVDYELAASLARTRIKDSESALAIAREEADAAREEWRLLHADGAETAPDPPALVARLPQLAAARARVEAHRVDLQKALLNLERTRIRAPFSGRVSEENVDVGQYVTAGQSLATLFSTEAVEIVIPLEDESLYWFHVPGFTPGEGPGAWVMVHARLAGRDRIWPGRVVRAGGKVDVSTRMINVVARVKEPYKTKPPLAVGLFVRVKIQGRTLENAAVIPRSASRENGVVWVVDEDGRLRFRQVEPARFFTNQVLIRSGLETGDRIVTSTPRVVTDGMKVRTADEDREDAP
ncbi:MAG: efflux RND transporter periplasmic adaptor subunit [Desulfobacterales bacterium]|nr:efflux RND transporter periplasmic adaptor subunit [Desulfobacterales bacterium]